MDFLKNILSWSTAASGNVNTILSYVLVAVLLIGGIFFTFRSKFPQFRFFAEQFRAVTEKPAGEKGVSSFQALMVSTASRVGTGNVVGVATAICVGGYGSVFWMWVVAIIGCASALVESTLAQIYKRRSPGGAIGGPAYYIEAALHSRTLAIIFSIFLILTYGFGFNMLASFNLQKTFESYSFYNATYTPWIIGLIVAVAVFYCLMGGGKRTLKITSFLVPVMGVAYILIAIGITVLHIDMLPDILIRIFKEAFDFKSIFGGFAGSCVMMGIKRGLFSNEAGVGSAPNASASADVSHPVKQGLVQMLSVFIDTILICSATAFMCLSSGIDIANYPTPDDAITYIQASFREVLGGFGPIFITVATVLFAFTTLLGNLYYVDSAIFYIFRRKPGKAFHIFYYITVSALILLGAGLSADLLWNIADITMVCMTLINIPVTLYLSKYAMRAVSDYTKQRKNGKNPVFCAKDIGLPHDVDYWK